MNDTVFRACVQQVQVHLLTVEAMDEALAERDERQLSWFKSHDAAAMVDEPELRCLLAMVSVMIGPT